MKRRTFFKALGGAIASLASFYVPSKPWLVKPLAVFDKADWYSIDCTEIDAGTRDALRVMFNYVDTHDLRDWTPVAATQAP